MIKFPKVHIATSVVNRILNIADGVTAQRASVSPTPSVPDTTMQSIALDEQLQSGVPGSLPGIEQAPDPGGSISGRPLLDTMLQPKQ